MTETSAQRLIVLAYILALAMPPLGVIVAVVVAVRAPGSASRHWPWIVLLSLIAGGIWAAIIASGALSSTNGTY